MAILVFQGRVEFSRIILRSCASIGTSDSKTTFYTRLHHNGDKTISNDWFNGFPVNNPFPLLTGSYEFPSRGVVGTLIHTFSPTLINEAHFRREPLPAEGFSTQTRAPWTK